MWLRRKNGSRERRREIKKKKAAGTGITGDYSSGLRSERERDVKLFSTLAINVGMNNCSTWVGGVGVGTKGRRIKFYRRERRKGR